MRAGADVKRAVDDIIAVAHTAGVITALRFAAAIVTSAPEIVRDRSLVPADLRMAGRSYRFRPLSGTVIELSGDQFSGAREMYCRRVYFALPGFEVQEGDVVVDLGANAGLFAVMAACSGARRIIAVEAQSEFLPLIRANLEQNGQAAKCEIEHSLVGSATGILSSPDRQQAATHWKTPPAIRSLTDIARRYHLDRIDLLKVDIEGSEFDLLSSDPDVLGIVRRVVMEVHGEFGEARELVSFFNSRGFRTHLVGSSGHVVEVLDEPSGYIFASRSEGTRE